MEHPPYFIGDRLPLEVIEKILISLDAQSAFLRARSVSKTWLAALDSLISRAKIPSRTYEERIQFAVFKFLSHYRHLLDQPKATAEEKKDLSGKKDKKNKKEKKSKEKKSKKHKSKKDDKIVPLPVQEPTPEPKVNRYDTNWLKKSFEAVLLDLPPSNKFLTVDKEKIFLRLWLFAEEEDHVRKMFASQMIAERIGLRIQLIGGYFMMIKANEFVDALEKNLMEILGPYRHNSLEVDPVKVGYQPTNIDTILEMARKAATATASILKLLPSKMVYILKLLYDASGNSVASVLAQLFVRFITPSVFDMFDPRKQKRKKIMPSSSNNRHLHLMAVIIQSALLGGRIREPYLERANSFSDELKKLIVPAFEELMKMEFNMKEVNKPFVDVYASTSDLIFLDLAIAAEILSEEEKK
jgi:hypothetical protein